MKAKITHYLCPICSGKTTRAYEIQNEDPENVLLIEVLPETDINYVYRRHIRGCKFKKIIIDNFLKLYDNKKNKVKCIIDTIRRNNADELILFSTPDHLYEEEKDKEELVEKFLDENESTVIYKKFWSGLSMSDVFNLTGILKPPDFQSKMLGIIYDCRGSRSILNSKESIGFG